MPYPVQTTEGTVVQIVEKLPDGTLIDVDGNVYKKTFAPLIIEQIEGQTSIFNEGGGPDELVLAGQEPVQLIDSSNDLEAADTETLQTPVEVFEQLINESADREKAAASLEDYPPFTQEDAEEVAEQIDAIESEEAEAVVQAAEEATEGEAVELEDEEDLAESA